MLNSIKANLDARRNDGDLDRADLVQTVLLIAGFAIVAILIVTWIGTAIANKGADAATCIEGSNTYSDAEVSATACDTQHASSNSFTTGTGYKNRY